MTPTIGSIVHYRSYGTPGGEYPAACRAAIVTAVDTLVAYRPGQDNLIADHERAIDLCVLNPSGVFFDQGLIQDETEQRPGTWHWPEREPGEAT